MKFTGIILVFLSSVFIGFHLSNRLKKRIHILDDIYELIVSIKIMIEAQCLTIEELFSSLADQKRFDDFFISKDAFLSTDCKKQIETECKRSNFLKDEDKQLFINFINELGSTYLDGQISIINGYLKQFDEKISRLKSEQGVKCRMYNSFGVLIGAFLSIILS